MNCVQRCDTYDRIASRVAGTFDAQQPMALGYKLELSHKHSGFEDDQLLAFPLGQI
jgi:hypothetical protein